MPRPRRDSEILPAKERLENAFWELLANREYAKITVTDVVHEADVNRNSFYYHFSGLPELADSAILHEVEKIPSPTPPELMQDPNQEWLAYCSSLLKNPDSLQRIDRLALLAGPHGSTELLDSLRDFMRMTLVSVLGLDPNAIDVKCSLLLDFSVGGLVAVLQHWPQLQESFTIEDMLNPDIAMLAMGIYLSMSKENMISYWHNYFKDHPKSESVHAAVRPETLSLEAFEQMMR